MSDLRLRARSATELVDAAFALYRRDPLQYILLTAFAYAPWLVLQLLILGDASRGDSVGSGAAMLVMGLGTLVAYSVVSAALVRLASDAYLGESMDVAGALRAALPRAGAIIVAALVRAVVVFIGLMLFVVPGLYFIGRFFALNQAIILEQRDVGSAFTRSSELSRGRKGHILVTLAIVGILYILLAMAVNVAAMLTGSAVLAAVIATAYVVVAYPLFGITETLLYYDARIRAEGYDIEVMTGALGGAGHTTEGAAR